MKRNRLADIGWPARFDSQEDRKESLASPKVEALRRPSYIRLFPFSGRDSYAVDSSSRDARCPEIEQSRSC